MNKEKISVFLLFFIFVVAGCSNKDKKSDVKKSTTVYASIEPVAFIVKSIVDTSYRVKTILPKGREPHNYDLTPRQIQEISKSSLLFTIGLPFENVISQKLGRGPKNSVRNVSNGIEFIKMESHSDKRETKDPHIWLDPVRIKKIGSNIRESLIEKFPSDSSIFNSNYERFASKVDSVSSLVSAKLKPFKGKKILVFHPAFGYFADRYGLIQESIEIEGKSPSAKQIEEVVSMAKSENIKVVFVQKEFDTATAKKIASLVGGTVCQLDPLEEDVISNIVVISNAIAEAFAK